MQRRVVGKKTLDQSNKGGSAFNLHKNANNSVDSVFVMDCIRVRWHPSGIEVVTDRIRGLQAISTQSIVVEKKIKQSQVVEVKIKPR